MIKSVKKLVLVDPLKTEFFYSGGILFLLKPQMKTSDLPFSINPLTNNARLTKPSANVYKGWLQVLNWRNDHKLLAFYILVDSK